MREVVGDQEWRQENIHEAQHDKTPTQALGQRFAVGVPEE